MKKRFHLVSLVLLGMIAGTVSIFQDAFGDTRPPSPEGMVLIPAGEFERGSNTGEADTDEQPVHTVYVDAFYMDETEVTNAQYKAFLTENPRWRKNGISAEFHDGSYLKLWNGNDYPKGKGDHPVTHVSWHAAMAYAEWTGKRLPTEAEWERAARGGLVGNAYPHGSTINPRDANYNINVGDTTAVGKYPKNAYGLYDMAGNVSEWCLDAYNYNFYPELSVNSVTRNPLLGDSGETSVEWLLNHLTLRDWPSVVRGGSWACKAQNVRVSDRFYSLPTFTNVATGFRCVRDTVLPSPVDPREQRVTQGALRVKVDDAVVECPLTHTDVVVNITGFIARVTVSQAFYNPYAEALAGVYVFPLPPTATMDALTMHIGDRKIVGVMKTGNEAYGIYDYDQALQRREIAGLVEQKVVGLSELKYPNIFTQSVESVEPHQAVEIEISYIDLLPYDKGTYEFHFPMVVGPRSIHVPSLSKQPDQLNASGSLPSTFDAGYRTGDDIRLSVLLDAGVPIQHIEIVNHASVVERGSPSKATVAFSPTGAIPNKDFVMKYTVAGEKPEMAVFAHAPGTEHRDFMFMIQPKIDAKPPKVTPREFVFLLNVSPEMSDESKAMFETMLHYEAEGDVLSALVSFEYAVNTLLDVSDNSAMAVFASPTHLLVYGDRGVHEKMKSLLAALRDSDIDIAARFGQDLSDAELAHLRALQTLTTARWKIYAGPSVVPDLRIASWELLAAALIGEVDREALKRLQTAWEDPRIDAVIESEYLLIAMRSLWCIRTAAQILPTDDELAALSQNVLSKVKRRRTLKLQKGSHIDYLGALYAVLALQNEGPYGVKKTLTERVVKGIYSDRSSRERLIAEALLSPSEKSDEALQSLLPLDSYFMDDAWSYDGDLIVLTCLAAKRRGGDVWRTFHEALSNTMRGSHRANGLVVVIVNRLAASQAIQ